MVAAGLMMLTGIALDVPASARAPSAPVLWPGGGRVLSAPLVVGANADGAGALEVVNGVTTRNPAVAGDAPVEMSLRMFTLERVLGGGYVATFRFRAAIEQLHEWRGQQARMTQTVILTPPDGGEPMAVQMQEDGGVVAGEWRDRSVFHPIVVKGTIIGNTTFIEVPPDLGVQPGWTVQARVDVVSLVPFDPAHPIDGWAAGTSIVPVGWLTGETSAAAAGGVLDAMSVLAPPDLPGDATSTPVDGVRVTGVRIDGEGTDRAVVVITAGSPLDVPAEQLPHISLLLAGPVFASTDHPAVVQWSGGAESDAVVTVAGTEVGTMPVTVSENETPFAVGATTPSAPAPVEPGTRLDTLQGAVTVGGLVVTVDGPNVTIADGQNGSTVNGFVDVDGTFVAIGPDAYYAGTIARDGSVTLRSLVAGPLEDVRSAESVTGTAPLTELSLQTSDLATLDVSWLSGADVEPQVFSGTTRISAEHGGLPDFSPTPLSDDPATTTGFLVHVSSGTFDTGFPIEVGTPWMSSTVLAEAPPVDQVPTTDPPATTVATSDDGGAPIVLIAVIVVAVVVIAGAIVFVRKRRPKLEPWSLPGGPRTPPPPP